MSVLYKLDPNWSELDHRGSEPASINSKRTLGDNCNTFLKLTIQERSPSRLRDIVHIKYPSFWSFTLICRVAV